MNDYKTWLQTSQAPKIAVVIVEPLYLTNPTTRYLCTHALNIDSSIDCLPIIKGDITLSENLSLDYSANLSYGDISLANNTGSYDPWLSSSYIWSNRPVRVYIGELPDTGILSLSDLELVFSGTIVDIDSKDNKTISIKIRDNLQQLNTSLSEALLGNYNPSSLVGYTNTYKNNLKPVCFGEVHNITPMLTAPGLLEYMVHLGEVEQIIEVRDNGVPIGFTQVGVPAGSFRLTQAPAGTITCSVQGSKATPDLLGGITNANYTNTASNTIAAILTGYGKPLTYSSLDSTSFGKLAQQPIGVYYTDRVNVLAACQDLAKNCGVVVATTRSGNVKLVDLGIPSVPLLAVGGYEAAPYGIALSASGDRLYVIGAASDRVRQFALSTAWDITTATYTTSYSILAQDTNSTDIQFDSTGTKMYVIGTTADSIFTYQLTTPWQVDTATLVSTPFNVSLYEVTPNALAFSADGIYVYVVGTSADTIRQFTMTTAYDLTTATYSGQSFSIASAEGNATGITFNTSGTLMFIVGVNIDQVLTYTLTTPWGISTAVLWDRVSITNIDTAPHSIAFSSDGLTMYISGDASNSIYQFKLAEAWNPKSMQPPIIEDGDIIYNSLQISERTAVTAGYKIGYAKNWTLQPNLLTAIPPEHKDLYAVEYLEESAVDTVVKTNYGVTTEPQLEQTYLIRATDAAALAAKKLNLFKTPRRAYSMRCTAKWLYLEIGDAVRLKFSRFDLDNGRLGQVTSAKPNWLRNYIDIEVLI